MNNQTMIANTASRAFRQERNRTFARGMAASLGYWMVLGCLLLAATTDTALGSCGEYLHHRSDFAADFLGQSQAVQYPAQIPVGACKDGKCGSQIPMHLPARDKVQVEERSSELNLIGVRSDFFLGLNGLVVECLFTFRQVFLEVAVPPPRVV